MRSKAQTSPVSRNASPRALRSQVALLLAAPSVAAASAAAPWLAAYLLATLLLVSPGAARAQTQPGEPGAAERPGAGEPQRLETVVIRADRTLEERFASTGSRVTINRNDIEQMGADTIADVLRQLPGVQTSGAASGNLEIRMRGMDRSATQILVDGQRVGSGRRSGQLPFDQLPADMIERIEVLRAPSAEYSGATGGTINIVLREASVRRETNVRLTNQHAFGDNGMQGFVSTTGPLNAPPKASAPQAGADAPGGAREPYLPWSYFLAMSANERLWGSNLQRETELTGPGAFSTASEERLRGRTRELVAMPRLNGRLSARDTVILRGTLLGSEFDSRLDSAYSGQTGAGAPMSGATRESAESRRHLIQLRGDWTRRLASSRLEVRLSGDTATEQHERERASSAVTGDTRSDTAIAYGDRRRERSVQTSAKLTGTEGSHVWMAGAELELRRLDVTTSSTPAGEAVQARAYDSTLARRVLWGQNEWGLPASTTLTAGLRLESLSRSSRFDGITRDENRTQWQPSLHTRTPLGDGLQFRSNLARTSRIPALADTIDRVTPSLGVNSPIRPDAVGNPALKAESTFSLDAGFEKRLANRGQAGVNVFVRAIDDLIIRRTSEVNGRWLQRPENLGRAIVWGLETDLKTDLAAVGAPGWNLGATASLLQSRLQGDQGYSGRIPGQAHYLLNINIARPMPRAGGFFGGTSVNFTGASDIGSNSTTQGRERAYVSVDAFVGQLISGLGYWRLGVSNLTNARKNRERIDADSAGGLRTERSLERYQTRVYLSVGTRW
ncbi:MAG: TonB-dependent receptor [Burkholderiaceae bacterium]|nr:TonB-dependent receptor [Burkholderiaceae bacterium]